MFLHFLLLFLFAYAILACVTALVLGVQTFLAFDLFSYRRTDWKSVLLGFGISCTLGLIGGVLFPYVWYKKLRG